LSANLHPHERAVGLARDLIRIPSLTPLTADLRPAAAQSLRYLQAFCEAAGARCTWLPFAGGHARWGYPVDNLHIEWGDASEPGGLCFLGHTDVVPPGDLAAWRRDPFSGAIEGGFLHGRGATDMKGAVAAFVAAAAARPQARASLIITTDEEWAAVNGTRRVLEWMRDSGRRPSGFVVGEPSSEEHFGAAIKLGRRGSLCGELHASGVQGHAAYPGLFVNSNRALSLGIAILHLNRWADASPGMPATSFETIAMASGDFGATAIIPGEARALWNIRFTHRQTPSTLATKLQQLLDNPPQWAKDHPDAPLLSNLRLIANSDTASMSYYSPPAALAALAKSIVHHRTGREPALDCKGGTTDGRFIHTVFPDAEIVELGLPECGGLTRDGQPGEFGKAGGMHQVDECCAIADLASLTRCYGDLLAAYAGGRP
jgi:succinyl-diaminopimelate desuccinylase